MCVCVCLCMYVCMYDYTCVCIFYRAASLTLDAPLGALERRFQMVLVGEPSVTVN